MHRDCDFVCNEKVEGGEKRLARLRLPVRYVRFAAAEPLALGYIVTVFRPAPVARQYGTGPCSYMPPRPRGLDHCTVRTTGPSPVVYPPDSCRVLSWSGPFVLHQFPPSSPEPPNALGNQSTCHDVPSLSM